MATFSLGTSIKIFGAASGGSTPSGSQFAVATYTLTSAVNVSFVDSILRVYGPGQTIPVTITVNSNVYTFAAGVIFENSP